MGTSTAVVRRYLDCVNAGDPVGIGELFAEDGRLFPPPPILGRLVGPAAITAFYTKAFEGATVTAEPQVFVEAGNRCVVTLRTTFGGRTTEYCDVFTIDDAGRIAEMVAYRRDESPAEQREREGS